MVLLVKLADALTMMQLAAGLNAAYTTFRNLNTQLYDRHTDVFDDLTKLEKRFDPNLNDNVLICGRITARLAEYNDFKSNIFWINSKLEGFVYYVGYSAFLFCCVFIGIASLYPNVKIEYYWILVIFIAAYFPLGVSLVFETYYRIKFNKITKRGMQVRDEALNLVPLQKDTLCLTK